MKNEKKDAKRETPHDFNADDYLLLTFLIISFLKL